VPTDQVVLGAGATGVALQALHALTAPGDAMAMAAPNFDGYRSSRKWRGWTR
jgi:histidinol-phosphate aminotransferase